MENKKAMKKEVSKEEILQLLYDLSLMIPIEIPFDQKLRRRFNRVEKHLKTS